MKPLYVHRPLKNGEAFVSWAKSQGFTNITSPGDLHVTIVYSRQPVDWEKFSKEPHGLTVTGGERSVVQLGEATVLKFESDHLNHRWKQFIDGGASWDYDGYQSHVTICYGKVDLDISKVLPYHGPLEFGPEVFDELDLDWKPKEE